MGLKSPMDQMGLFSTQTHSHPLAYRMRPKKLSDYQGQRKVIEFIKKFKPGHLPHLILWGPPGSGKTTLAHIFSQDFGLEFYPFNAVMSGVPELRKIIQKIIEQKQSFSKNALLFIDEIHRFNKAQQDALLPHLEKGDFLLVGATTEYPSTSLNKAILSRVRTLKLEALNKEDLLKVIERATKEQKKEVPEWVSLYIAEHSNGDARSTLNSIESLWESGEDLNQISEEEIKKIIGINRQYDKNADRHYDVISAFIKSLRGSDPDAALLWLAVMIDGGEDPLFIARRLVIQASEDIGNANPQALIIANSALQAVKEIGFPEARIILAQATTYIASSPKSNASYLGINKALEFVKEHPTLEVPTHLRNHHPDKKDYKYAHSYPGHYVKQNYLPEKVQERFYLPTEQGFEKKFKEYLESLGQM